MRIAWEDLSDDASVSTDSEVTTLPASNVQQEHVAQKWHTLPTVKAAYLIFDMGGSVTCDILAVLGANFTSSATVRIRASLTDPTVTSALVRDTGVISAGVNDDYGAIYKDVTETTARYWRLDFSDVAVEEDHLEVGRVFLGPSWEPTYDMLLGVAYASMDPSEVMKSRAGQRFAEELPQMRTIQFELAFMDEAEMFDNAFALARRNGIVTDVLVVPDISSASVSQRSVFGPCTFSQPLVNDIFGLYRQKFNVEERL